MQRKLRTWWKRIRPCWHTRWWMCCICRTFLAGIPCKKDSEPPGTISDGLPILWSIDSIFGDCNSLINDRFKWITCDGCWPGLILIFFIFINIIINYFIYCLFFKFILWFINFIILYLFYYFIYFINFFVPLFTSINVEKKEASGLGRSAIGVEIGVSYWIVDGESSVVSVTGVAVDDIDERRIRTAQPPACVYSFESRVGGIESYIPFSSEWLQLVWMNWNAFIYLWCAPIYRWWCWNPPIQLRGLRG